MRSLLDDKFIGKRFGNVADMMLISHVHLCANGNAWLSFHKLSITSFIAELSNHIASE